MILQIIFFVTMYPLLFVMYFLLRNAGNVDKTYIYGATLKKEYRTEAEVIKITEEYREKIRILREHGILGKKVDRRIKDKMKQAVVSQVLNNQATREELGTPVKRNRGDDDSPEIPEV